jgi:hypothetical protein
VWGCAQHGPKPFKARPSSKVKTLRVVYDLEHFHIGILTTKCGDTLRRVPDQGLGANTDRDCVTWASMHINSSFEQDGDHVSWQPSFQAVLLCYDTLNSPRQSKMLSSSTPSTAVSAMRQESKLEERSPSSLQSQWKHSTHSALTQSRWSRTLSPSSWRQGALKTIIMKKGGESVQKKWDLARLFCQDRKIACGRLPGDHHQPKTHTF